MFRVYIIAEVGVNHNGSIDLAKKLVFEAKKANADCVKFQTFKAEQIVTMSSPKAKYQLNVTDKNESQFEMLKKLELNLQDYKELLSYCKELKIDFLSTPYNIEDLDFLNDLGVDSFKIASGQLTELPFLIEVAKKQKRMIISTGMATLSDVYDAVEAIRSVKNDNIIVLQCTTNYPSRIEDSNIYSMNSIKESCAVNVGYSDHVSNNFACFSAVALGAEIIEKHLTLDKDMEGPDHSCSLNPSEFKDLVYGIRQVELSLGSKVKRPSKIESENSLGMKRGMVMLTPLKKGNILQLRHVGFKRPFKGIPINYLDKIIGKELAKDLVIDESIDFDCIQW